MKKYFYSDGKEKHGPFNFEELKQKDINNDTLIWFEGLDDWKPISDLVEMKSILELIPPPILSFDKNPKNENTDKEKEDKESTESQNYQNVKYKQKMFSYPFSFKGRIRRTEYGISVIIYFILNISLNIYASPESAVSIITIIFIFWFLLAQGAKRCHDIGHSGWFQIIPFYVLWMIFANAEVGINEYGRNPKN